MRQPGAAHGGLDDAAHGPDARALERALFVRARLHVDDVQVHGHADRHRALEALRHGLHGRPQLREQGRVDHIRIAEGHRGRADEVAVEPIVVVEEAECLQAAAQAADRRPRNAQALGELAVGMGARIAHEALKDQQALGERAREIRVVVAHLLQVLLVLDLVHGAGRSHAAFCGAPARMRIVVPISGTPFAGMEPPRLQCAP